jgi:hypothetical protein
MATPLMLDELIAAHRAELALVQERAARAELQVTTLQTQLERTVRERDQALALIGDLRANPKAFRRLP